MPFALLLLALTAGVEPYGPELLPNPGFEQVGQDGSPADWHGFWTKDWGEGGGQVASSTVQPHAGQRCVEVAQVKGKLALAPVQRLEISAQQGYLFTAWVKTALRPGEKAYLSASWSSTEHWLSLESSRPLYGRHGWTQMTMVLRSDTRPAEAATVLLSVRVESTSGKGQIWVDDGSFRTCRLPEPPSAVEGEWQRMVDLTRELLVERAVLGERLAVASQHGADLAQLLQEHGAFDELVQRHGAAVRSRRFLSQAERPRAAFEQAVTRDAEQVIQQARNLSDVPARRNKLASLRATLLAQKRELDARPELRRFYLWTQLNVQDSSPGALGVPGPQEADRELLKADVPDPAGELLNAYARCRYAAGQALGEVTLHSDALTEPAELVLGVLDADGRVAAASRKAVGTEPFELALPVGRPHPWFPDAPYLYTLRAVLVRDGKVVDEYEQRIAFRDIRLVQSDISPTLRHVWSWAPVDYTYLINGQPYFPHSTVLGSLRSEDLEPAAKLFSELWLDTQRTYGNFLDRLGGEWGRVFADHGLTYDAGVAADYNSIRSYVSSERGLEGYAERLRAMRRLADHPALLSLQVGNEEELAVWGADLPSVYGDDLWQCFSEVGKVVRRELQPNVPVGYVRAGSFSKVLPALGLDYSGVNQYAGRYWGRRSTIASDLAALSRAAQSESRPIGITEWNGPKYSWATSGVSGIDEEGVAQFLFEYYRNLVRTPSIAFSTEFVLNWVVTPLEDLTTVPLQQGLENRGKWQWSLQQGTPWYPRVFPDLLTDTPARRAMRGFQSPLLPLVETPGELRVAGPAELTEPLVQALAKLGQPAQAVDLPTDAELRQTNAHWILLPEPVRETSVSGIQRRINPNWPDRGIVRVTARDAAGRRQAVDKLLASAAGLAEAYARQATCRRLLALVDEKDDGDAFRRYVLELPTRSRFLGRDDLRTELNLAELLEGNRLTEPFADLGALLITARRALTSDEQALVAKLSELGVNVVWSAAALQANQPLAKDLGVAFAGEHALTDTIPVAAWAQQPLVVPELGDASVQALEQFGNIKQGSDAWQREVGIRGFRLGAGWQSAATLAGEPLVARKAVGQAHVWVFGNDLAATAQRLWSTTHRGVNHGIYDRDTACGLERVFRLMANACADGLTPRPADTPRLRATLRCDREDYPTDGKLTATVRVRDSAGQPVDGTVRISLTRDTHLPKLDQWWTAKRVAPGESAVTIDLAKYGEVPADRMYRGERLLDVVADVTARGYVPDWLSHTVRVGSDSTETAHLTRLAELLSDGRIEARLNLDDREQWVEITATMELPRSVKAGQPLALPLSIDRVENPDGNDFMEDTLLVLKRTDGREVTLPVAAGKYLTARKSSVMREHPKQCLVVADEPVKFDLRWDHPEPGEWQPSLRYRYTDDFHIKDTDRVPRDDAFGRFKILVEP